MTLLRTLYTTGNSVVIAIPKPYLNILGLKPGDAVMIDFSQPHTITLNKPEDYFKDIKNTPPIPPHTENV